MKYLKTITENIFIKENWDVIIFLIISLGVCVYTAWYFTVHPHITVRYDCSVSEISPDYPLEVKEGCRKLRAEKFKETLQKPK